MTNPANSTRSEIAVYLGLGSNIGDREAYLSEAIARIIALGVEVKTQSSIYETEPVGFADQPWFLNQIIEVRIYAGVASGRPVTSPANQAQTLLSELLEIERNMGRKRAMPYGPRVIDIDLLLFGDLVITQSKEDSKDKDRSIADRCDIIVPHPRLHLRRFVLQPLCEIAPNLIHPVLRKTIRDLLLSLEEESEVRIFKQRVPRS